jgi:hypothetical protein
MIMVRNRAFSSRLPIIEYRKLSTLQRSRLLHTKILSPVKIKYPACLSCIMITEKSTSFISLTNLVSDSPVLWKKTGQFAGQ